MGSRGVLLKGGENLASNARSALYRILDTVGDGTGTKNANLDFDATPDEFFIQPPAGKLYVLHRILYYVGDVGKVENSSYGAIAGGITNGWKLEVVDNADVVLLDFNDGISYKRNIDLGGNNYDVTIHDDGVGKPGWVAVRFTFAKAGRPIILEATHRMRVAFSDDLTPLTEHYFQVQGYSVSLNV